VFTSTGLDAQATIIATSTLANPLRIDRLPGVGITTS
jgi:hypothetical protein